jgi:hypothetical protein
MHEFIRAGYTVKHVVNRPVWLKSANVKKIFSAIECVSKCPIDHDNEWRHNGLALYNNEQDLRVIIEKNNLSPGELTWFYYEIYENQLSDGIWKKFIINNLKVEKPDGYEFRGYDIVFYSTGNVTNVRRYHVIMGQICSRLMKCAL